MLNKLKFESVAESDSIIKVIGVGGGGSNAVTHMYNMGITGVDFVICNTDAQALEISPVSHKIQLGLNLTEGRGAGSKPEVGRNAAIESIDVIKEYLNQNTKMLFITAGMGGGTGTGAAPVIAAAAKELGILTVAIVTIPFSFEGRKRMSQALEGIKELRRNVDSLLLICNDKLRELYGDLSITTAFVKADDVLNIAAKGIADIVNRIGKVNVDFEDVNTVMRNSGVAIMGSASAEGENRAIQAITTALASPLLNDNNIRGANNILLYITSGTDEIRMDEITEITDFIQQESGSTAEIIWGLGVDESIGNKISITLVATGFDTKDIESGINNMPVTSNKKIVPLVEPEQHIAPKEIIVNKVEDVIEDIRLIKNANNQNIEIKVNEIDYNLDSDEIRIINKQDIKETVDNSDSMQEEIILIPRNESSLNNQDNRPVSSKEQEYALPDAAVNDDPDALKDYTTRARENRYQRLKDISIKLKSSKGIAELENQPAYVRRNVPLTPVTPASESIVSRYSLTEDENKNVEIKSNNSFLHDNVD